MLDEFKFQVETLSPRAKLRRRRIGELENSRIDDTHPPTFQRIQVLQAAPQEATIVLTPDQSAEIDRELLSHRDSLSEEMVKAYRASLYA